MSFHDELVAQTARERNGLLSVPIIQSALAGRIAREDYVAFLNQAFHHVRHTVPLLMACGARLPARLEWLRTAVGEYIEEEMGHHEWVLDDIAACGEDRAAAEASSPSLATELMVSYAYDTIQRGNPVGFFGMVQVLGEPAQPAFVAAHRQHARARGDQGRAQRLADAAAGAGHHHRPAGQLHHAASARRAPPSRSVRKMSPYNT